MIAVSTALLVVLIIIVLLLWGVYRLLKMIFLKIRKSFRDRKRAKDYARAERKRAKDYAKAEREVAEFEASIAMTKIIDQRKVFDSSRKYHHETTFMVYFKDGKKIALTVRDGSYQYDAFITRLRE